MSYTKIENIGFEIIPFGGKQMITLVIANNQPVVRAGIRSMLKNAGDIQIVGETDNGHDIQSLVTQLRPRILLMDLNLPGPSAVEIAKWLQANFPETALLVFTSQDKDAFLATMMNAGAVGFLSTEIPAKELVAAIRSANAGEILFDETQMRRVEEWQKAAGEKWAKLTKRQRQVLQMLVNGLSKVEVAKQLRLSVRGVEFHIDATKKILKVKSTLVCVNWLHKYFPENSGALIAEHRISRVRRLAQVLDTAQKQASPGTPGDAVGDPGLSGN